MFALLEVAIPGGATRPVQQGGREWAGCNVSLEFRDPDGYMIELTCKMEQIGWNQSARPRSMHRRAKSLEETVANHV